MRLNLTRLIIGLILVFVFAWFAFPKIIELYCKNQISKLEAEAGMKELDLSSEEIQQEYETCLLKWGQEPKE